MTNKAGWTGFDAGSGVWDGRDNPRLRALVPVSKYVFDDDLEARRRFEPRAVLPGGELDARPCCGPITTSTVIAPILSVSLYKSVEKVSEEP